MIQIRRLGHATLTMPAIERRIGCCTDIVQRPKVWGPDTLRNYWGFGSEPVIRGYQTIQ